MTLVPYNVYVYLLIRTFSLEEKGRMSPYRGQVTQKRELDNYSYKGSYVKFI